MQKRVLSARLFRQLFAGSRLLMVAMICAAALMAACGKSECKKYVARFCADAKSQACSDATARSKDWNSDRCRIEANKLAIEEQSKQLDELLK
ncbi:MAG TPA: hypothetical protein PKW28_13790 [Turneriella sp.]|nr:hypothetical protein [Turneriella sp.]